MPITLSTGENTRQIEMTPVSSGGGGTPTPPAGPVVVPNEPSGSAVWVGFSDGSSGWFDAYQFTEMVESGQFGSITFTAEGPFTSGSTVTL
jgi:hypothetical protein